MELTWILILFHILPFDVIARPRRCDWLDHLLRYRKNTMRNPQMLLILDDDQDYRLSLQEELVQQILREQLILAMTFAETSSRTSKNFGIFETARDTSLSVIISSGKQDVNLTRLARPVEFLKGSTTSSPRPKCLIVLLQQKLEGNYEKFFREMWAERFLDVTILEHIGGLSSETLFSKPENSTVSIHQYNPFVDFHEGYKKERYSPSIEWFPNKLQNMQGSSLKVGVFSYPPRIVVERDSLGYPIKIMGPDGKMFKELSEGMNFKIEHLPSLVDGIGKFDCNISQTTGYLYQIYHQEIHLLAVCLPIVIACEDSKPTVISRVINWEVICAVVPRMFNDPKTSLLFQWRIFSSLTVILTTVYITSRLLRFQQQFWSLKKIFCAISGISVTEPSRGPERMLFASLLIVSLMLSSDLYSILFNQMRSEREMNTIQDILDANLTPKVESNLFTARMWHADGELRQLFNKSDLQPDVNKICIEELLKNRDITCVMRKPLAEKLLQSQREESGYRDVKIVEPLWNTIMGVVFEANSPYVEHFNVVMLRLIESGSGDKWNMPLPDESEVSIRAKNEFNESEDMEVHLLRKKLLGVAFFGYLTALIAFVAEILVHALFK